MSKDPHQKLKVQLVLIDLDGTLVDSVPDLAYAIDGMMSQLDLPQRGEEKVRQWIGNGVERLVKRALVDQMSGEPEEALFKTAFHLFEICYKECNGQYSRLFSGVRQGIDWLKSQNLPLACITNKAEQFTIPLLKALNLFNDFQLVISGDTLPKQKPDPMPLLHVANHFGIAPAQSLMIGDSTNDIQAARAAGFPILCVTYGYNHGHDIRTAGADVVIDSLAELPNSIIIEK
ncbi:phosphoglycolate phosphatase [Candidatus Parabeggiatoa sp. HSG14]|uniref:phosphoglycolate phosphatase n=1 Tax=Candidatus Parabeggiatoa sp. HSG14 TaxID=3055593 RepID=UPI0025A883F0|nr:phosphoglycolate phosphatase [Thiotrichales bacterium HSG14]